MSPYNIFIKPCMPTSLRILDLDTTTRHCKLHQLTQSIKPSPIYNDFPLLEIRNN